MGAGPSAWALDGSACSRCAEQAGLSGRQWEAGFLLQGEQGAATGLRASHQRLGYPGDDTGPPFGWASQGLCEFVRVRGREQDSSQ